MAKQSQKGQSESEPKDEGLDASSEGQSSQTPGDEQTPDIPDKWKGKSAEEVAKAYEELEKKLGNQANELGELRNTISYYDRQIQQQYASQQNPYGQSGQYGQGGFQQGQSDVPDDASFFDKPSESVRALVRKELFADQQQRKQEEMRRIAMDAYSNFEEGKRHMSRNKRLFEGIENEVASSIQQLFTASGGTIPPNKLRDPEAWELVARHLRFQRGEYDRIAPSKPSPTAPVSTGEPDSVKRQPSEKLPVHLSDADRGLVRMFVQKGYFKNEDEVVEQMRKEKERGE